MNLSLKCFSWPKCFPQLDRHTIASETKLASKMGCLVLALPAPPRPAGHSPVCSGVRGDISFLTDLLPLPNLIIWRPSSFPEISAISQLVSRALFKITIENLSRPFGLISLIIFPLDFFPHLSGELETRYHDYYIITENNNDNNAWSYYTIKKNEVCKDNFFSDL